MYSIARVIYPFEISPFMGNIMTTYSEVGKFLQGYGVKNIKSNYDISFYTITLTV